MKKKTFKDRIDEKTLYTLIYYSYSVFEEYVTYKLGEKLYKNNIELDFQESNCSMEIYVKDLTLKDEYDFYDDICELAHIHWNDMLIVLTKLDEEVEYINKRLDNYLKYKKSQE